MKPGSIWCNASKLASSTKVAQWLAYLKASQITEAVYTKEEHLKDLAEAARWCKEHRAPSAYVKAIECLGRCSGHYVEKSEITHVERSDQELLAKLEAALGPEARRAAERRLGIKGVH
jgi:hypothetical protein